MEIKVGTPILTKYGKGVITSIEGDVVTATAGKYTTTNSMRGLIAHNLKIRRAAQKR